MSKHKKRKHKRVADPYDDYMQKRHAYWAACAKKGELTEEQAHTCDELEMFVSAVIVFSDISPKIPKCLNGHGVFGTFSSGLPASRRTIWSLPSISMRKNTRFTSLPDRETDRPERSQRVCSHLSCLRRNGSFSDEYCQDGFSNESCNHFANEPVLRGLLDRTSLKSGREKPCLPDS